MEAQQPYKLPPEPELKPVSPRPKVERVEPPPPVSAPSPAPPQAAPTEPVGRKSLEEHFHPTKVEDDPLKSFPKSEGKSHELIIRISFTTKNLIIIF